MTNRLPSSNLLEILSVNQMLDQMPQFRKDQRRAGKFDCGKASRHAKNHGLIDDARGGTGHDGGRIDLFKTELGENRTERGQLFVKQRPNRLDGDIPCADTGAAGQQQRLGGRMTDDAAPAQETGWEGALLPNKLWS